MKNAKERLTYAIGLLTELVEPTQHVPIYDVVRHRWVYALNANESTPQSRDAATKVIEVEKGVLRIVFHQSQKSHSIASGETFEIPPDTPHFLIADQDVRFFLWFKSAVNEQPGLSETATARSIVQEPVGRTSPTGRRARIRYT